MPVLPINAGDVPSQNKMTGAWRQRIARTGCSSYLQPHIASTYPRRRRRVIALYPDSANRDARERSHQVLISGSIRSVVDATATQILPRISPFSAGVNAAPESHLPYQFVPLSPVQSPAPRLLDAWFVPADRSAPASLYIVLIGLAPAVFAANSAHTSVSLYAVVLSSRRISR